MPYSRFLLLLFLLCAIVSPCWALTISTYDQHGKPLIGAVIEYSAANSIAISKKNRPTAIMDQINKQFSPELIIIQKGDLVSFPNSDDIRHHVYSFSAANTFELKLYKGSHEAPLKFDDAGVVVLGCNIHDSMVGYIFVTETEAGLTDSRGKLMIDGASPQTINVWHPHQKMDLDKKMHFTVDTTNKELRVQIEITQPAPRDTFTDKFRSNASTSP